MKSAAARAQSGSHDKSFSIDETPPPAVSDVRVEDLGDGSAQVSLRLPWPMVLQVLDLASKGASSPSPALT